MRPTKPTFREEVADQLFKQQEGELPKLVVRLQKSTDIGLDVASGGSHQYGGGKNRSKDRQHRMLVEISPSNSESVSTGGGKVGG